jgi:aryl-alcohol dehydrogenase-like predicted oxidoreductase
MQYRTLGRTGIKVSPYALGAMMFGAPPGNSDHHDAIRIIHKALDAGINFIDTAERYSDGESEEIVGKALVGRRDRVVLATKVRPFNMVAGDDPNQGGNSRRYIMTAVEDSLRRLQTDHIDLYQIHRPDPGTDIEETLSALSDLVRSGKVRAIGSSTMPASDIVEAQWAAERRGLERFRSEQPPYSILNRGIEAEVLPVAHREGHAHRPHPPGPADRPAPRRHVHQLQRRGPARRRRADRPPRRGDRPADDAPGDGVRDHSSRRDQRDHRAAHDGAPG